jgi:hypothetical protein
VKIRFVIPADPGRFHGISRGEEHEVRKKSGILPFVAFVNFVVRISIVNCCSPDE